MTTHTSASDLRPSLAHAGLFERVAGICALLVAVAYVLYATSFFVLHSSLFNAIFLMLVGLFSLLALTAVYRRVADIDAGLALLSFLLVSVGAFGTLIHGAYDLANTLRPPAIPGFADLPNPVDPRGLLTFGIAGLGIILISWLIGRSHRFQRGLNYLGYLTAILLLILYLSRLIIFTVTNPLIVITALFNGFLVNPLWYLWLGIVLLRTSTARQEPAVSPVEHQ
jgi:hypothetical protein